MGWFIELQYGNSEIEVYECDTCNNPEHNYIRFIKSDTYFTIYEIKKVLGLIKK